MTAETLKPFITPTSENFVATHATAVKHRQRSHSQLLPILLSVFACITAGILLAFMIWNTTRIKNLQADIEAANNRSTELENGLKSVKDVVESMRLRLNLQNLESVEEMNEFNRLYGHLFEAAKNSDGTADDADNTDDLEDEDDDADYDDVKMDNDDDDEDDDDNNDDDGGDDDDDVDDTDDVGDDEDDEDGYESVDIGEWIKKYKNYDDNTEEDDNDDDDEQTHNLSDDDNLYDDFEKFKDSKNKKNEPSSSTRKTRSIESAANEMTTTTMALNKTSAHGNGASSSATTGVTPAATNVVSASADASLTTTQSNPLASERDSSNNNKHNQQHNNKQQRHHRQSQHKLHKERHAGKLAAKTAMAAAHVGGNDEASGVGVGGHFVAPSRGVDEHRRLSPLRPRKQQRRRHNFPAVKSGESLIPAKYTTHTDDDELSQQNQRPAAHFHLIRTQPRHTVDFPVNAAHSYGDVYIGQPHWSNGEHDFTVIDGILHVHTAGLYYIYAQVCYNNTHDQNGFVIFHNAKPFLQCLNTVPTPTPYKVHTCHTSGLIKLDENETIHLRDVHTDRGTNKNNDRSFFGIMKI